MFASADAIHAFNEDLLGYGDFARTIARGIANRTNVTEPYVVGIDASWGMGKTSAANLICQSFTELNNQSPSDERRVHVVRFSPWLFSSLDALVISYIGELTGALKTSFPHRLGWDWDRLRKRLFKRYGKLLASASKVGTDYWLPGFGGATASAVRVLTEVADQPTEEITDELRTKILQMGVGQLVIIVDDIDRLHPDEMRNLLTLVTTVGNLPRVTHILLHDRKIVDSAMMRSLGHGQNGGPTYLEKIVQLPVALPTIDSVSLRDFFISRVQQSSGRALSDEEQAELRDLWRDSLRRILTTPRDITRLTNALAAILPAIAEFVVLSDLVGIEALRLTKSSLWEMLRDNRRVLVGDSDPVLERVRASSMEGAAVRNLVLRLFPMAAADDEIDYQSIGRRGQRAICSPSSVDAYFRFQPGGVLPRSFLTSLAEGTTRTGFADRLRTISNRADLRSLLNDLGDKWSDLHLSPAELFYSLCDAGDVLIGRFIENPPALHDIEVFRDLDEIIWSVLKAVPGVDRFDLVGDVIRRSRSTAVPVIVWQRLGLRGGPLASRTTSSRQPLIPDERFIELGHDVGGRLMGLFVNDRQRLMRLPLLGWVLRIWGLTSETSIHHTAVRTLTSDSVSLPFVIDGLLGHAVSSDEGPYRSVPNEIDLPPLTNEELRAAVQRALSENNFPAETAPLARQILEIFMRGEE